MENVNTQTVLKSKFTGRLIGIVGIKILLVLVSIITLGIAFPAMICWLYKWLYANTHVDGKQLHFDGKGRQLFGKWILWLFLSIITLSIYSWWIPIKLKQWEISHVHIADNVKAAKQ